MPGTNDAPRASTSKEGAEPRFSFATTGTTYHDPPSARIHPAVLRQHIAATTSLPSPADNTVFFAGPASGLAKLQTYLPTGTWITYTALETWAFSLRPDDAPITPLSNCNPHQRNALLIVLVLSAGFSFFSSFIKRFVYDASRTHVVFPPPNYFRVAESATDPVTGVQFPCRTRGWRYCWPLVNDAGEFVYDESGTRLRVAVFRADVPVLPRRRRVWSWRSCFEPDPDVDIPLAPHLYTSPAQPAAEHSSPTGRAISIDAVAATPPELIPRWSRTLMGSQGSAAYVDLRASVWGHALVSLLAFLALALCSAQVCGCLYPTIPDFLPPPLQSGALALLSVIAAVAVQDRAVSLGQPAMQWGGMQASNVAGAEVDVPEHLRSVVEMVVWVGRQDIVREKV